MRELSTKDYRLILDLGVGALQHADPDTSPWQHVCQELNKALGANIAGVMDVRWPIGSLHGETWPSLTRRIPVADACLVTAHPLIRHYAMRSDTAPRTISDVISTRQWRRSSAYRRTGVDLVGASHQLAIPLVGSPGTIRSVVIGRAGRDFSPRDRLFVERLQPLLTSLDLVLQTTGRWRAGSPAGADRRAVELALTPREIAVLALLAEGMTAHAMGRRLGITVSTVSKHQQRIYRKLGTRDRLTTVLTARTFGLLRDDQERRADRPPYLCGADRTG